MKKVKRKYESDEAPQLRYAIMCRVSTPGQQRDGISLEMQEQQGRDYIERIGGKIVEVYSFQETARKSTIERRQFQQVLADATENRWDVLWTRDQARLARSLKEMAQLIELLVQQRLAWHMLSGDQRLDTPGGKMTAQIMSVMAEYETDRFASTTRFTREKLLSEGKHACGRWPWGRVWDKKQGCWNLEKEKVALIQSAYKYYIKDRKSIKDTAALIGMKASTLTTVFRRSLGTEWPIKFAAADGHTPIVLTIPALLNSDQIASIHSRSAANRTVRPSEGTRTRWMLQGMIRCAECGSNLSGQPSRKRDGSRYNIYRHLPHTKKPLCVGSVPASLIETAVLSACSELINDSTALVAAIRRALEQGRSKSVDTAADLRQLQSSRTSAMNKMNREQDNMVKHNAGTPAYSNAFRRVTQLSDEIEEIDKHFDQLQVKIRVATVDENDAEVIAARLRALCYRGVGPRSSMSLEQQRQLIAVVVGRLTRQSKQGVYVSAMKRIGSYREVVWPWQLHGALGGVEGEASNFMWDMEPYCRNPSIMIPDAGIVSTLVALARDARPIAIKKPSRGKGKLSGCVVEDDMLIRWFTPVRV